MSVRRPAELTARDATADHQHGIADASLGEDSACRSHGAEGFFGAEGLLGKLQQRRAVLRDQVWSHGAIAYGNRRDFLCILGSHLCANAVGYIFRSYLSL